jgi:hypothetical protein
MKGKTMENQSNPNEKPRTDKVKLAVKGAFIGGGIVVAIAAIEVIITLTRLNARMNYAEDRGSEFVEAINQLLADVRELKGEPSYR